MRAAQVAGHAAPRARRHPQAHARRPPRGPQGPHLARRLLQRPALPPGARTPLSRYPSPSFQGQPPLPACPFPLLHMQTCVRAHASLHPSTLAPTCVHVNTHTHGRRLRRRWRAPNASISRRTGTSPSSARQPCVRAHPPTAYSLRTQRCQGTHQVQTGLRAQSSRFAV